MPLGCIPLCVTPLLPRHPRDRWQVRSAGQTRLPGRVFEASLRALKTFERQVGLCGRIPSLSNLRMHQGEPSQVAFQRQLHYQIQKRRKVANGRVRILLRQPRKHGRAVNCYFFSFRKTFGTHLWPESNSLSIFEDLFQPCSVVPCPSSRT